MSHDDTTYERLLADNNIVGSVGLKLDEIDQAVRCRKFFTVLFVAKELTVYLWRPR